MDSLASQQDRVLERLEKHGIQGDCGPKLNEEREAEYWLSQPGSPKAQLADEKPQGQTISYDALLKTWAAE
jgi:glycerol transport system substrate-binding protein